MNSPTIAQRYWITNKEMDYVPAIGAFVYEGNDSNLVVGFVSDYFEELDAMEICLFKAADISIHEGIILYQEKCNVDDMLANVFKRNPIAKQMWIELVTDPNNTIQDDERPD